MRQVRTDPAHLLPRMLCEGMSSLSHLWQISGLIWDAITGPCQTFADCLSFGACT